MKILFLVQKEQRIILDRLYDGVAAHSECDLRWLSSDEQANLLRYFRENVDVSRYERIVLFLRFKKEMRQPLFILACPISSFSNTMPGRTTSQASTRANSVLITGACPPRECWFPAGR